MFVSNEATILHADVDSFFASVEQRDDPRLRGRPVIVGGWVVLAASYEAKAAGVRTAMSAARGAAPLSRRRSSCSRGCARTRRRARRCSRSSTTHRRSSSRSRSTRRFSTCAGCGGSRDRLPRSPRACGSDVRERVGLPITVGVARTKFLAKVASGVAKPDGLLVVEPDRELDFLHPLAVERLWGVGPATARKLHAVRLLTVGDVAGLSEETLVALLGRASGRQLYALSRNRDARRVRAGRRRGSIGAQRALGRSSTSPEALDATLVALVDRITRRMRAAGRVGRTVVLRLRFGDFSRATRSHTLPRPTAQTLAILATARGAPRGGAAGDRGAGPDARRHLRRQPRERRCRPTRAAVRRRRAGCGGLGGRRRAQPLRHAPRSPAECSSAGIGGFEMPHLPD